VNIDLRHIGLLGAAYVKSTMTGGRGIAFLALFALLGGIIALVIINPMMEMMALVQAQFDAEVADALSPVVSWWIGGDGPTDPRVAHLLMDKPAIISAILVILTGFMPFVTVAASANQLSRDIANKGLRYLLLRTERINILMSRFLGAWFVVSSSTFVLVMSVGIYVGAAFDYVGFGDAVLWSLQGWGALTWVALPYVGLCSFISVAVPVPAVAGILAIVTTGVMPLMLNKLASEFNADWIARIDPWGWKYHMLDPTFGDVAVAGAVLAVFALIPLSLAAVVFGRRNL